LKLKTAGVEIIRIRTSSDSPVVGKSLRELGRPFKKAVVIGCIIRQNTVIIPQGDTVVAADDEVMVLSSKKNVALVKKLFRPEH
jgi:trk system potassium uptake protein TrkA